MQQIMQQPSMPQPNTQTQQQGAQPQSQHPEMPGKSSHALHSTSAVNGTQAAGGTVPPFNHPSGLGFPPPPFPALWDPMSWWMHYAHHQAAYPYAVPGYGGNYGYTAPPPHLGASQRGFIKPPPGLSKKHQRLWETQSVENMQLWATSMQLGAAVSRADAEIACQRTKILKLECDLQTLREQYDCLMESSAGAAAPPSVKRGRGKKFTSAPVAIVGLPASQVTPARAQGKKAKVMVGKLDLPKNPTDVGYEETSKGTTGIDCLPEAMESSHNEDQKANIIRLGSNRDQLGAEKASHSSDIQNHLVYIEKATLNFNHLVQNSPFRPTFPVGGVKENCNEASMEEMKEAPVRFAKGGGELEKQIVALVDRRDNCHKSVGDEAARSGVLGGLLQAQYGSTLVELSNACTPGKEAPAWQYSAEDGSDEQEDPVASGQDDEDDEDEDAISGDKIGNYIVLDSATAIPKEMPALGRW